jgi:hypothetical protein
MQPVDATPRFLGALALIAGLGFGSGAVMAMEGPAGGVAAADVSGTTLAARTELGANAIVQDERCGMVEDKRSDATLTEYLEMHGRAENGLSGRAALMPWTSLRSAIN